jgi:hypothetical protein
MEIYITYYNFGNVPEDALLFRLNFEPKLDQFALKIVDPIRRNLLVDEFVHVGSPPNKSPYVWRYHFSASGASKQLNRRNHPHTLLTNTICEAYNRDPHSISSSVMLALAPDLAVKHTVKIENMCMKHDFAAALSNLTGGSVTVLFANKPDTKMIQLSENDHLFSLTCIFPWAIDLIVKHPNCLMTDSTFKACLPYTLAVLHVVVANESLPIAFGLSPTETAESYARIYHGLTDLLLAYHSQPDMVHQAGARSDSTSVEPEGGDEWPDDIGPDREEELAGEDDTLHHGREFSQGEGGDEGSSESISIERPRDQGELCSLPLVTDQGTALQCFVRKWQLDWKLCHRHIIESVGARSLIGTWVARLLRCYSREEYNRTQLVIINEMKLLRLDNDTDQSQPLASLKRMLGLVDDGHPLCNLKHWALWERLGCPRTTNSAESVNAHLNADVTGLPDFFDRVRAVANHFMKRYRSRNQWCDRALFRNASKCFPSDQERGSPWFSEMRNAFYRKLHNATELTERTKRRFPPEDPRCIFAANSRVVRGNFVVPESWIIERETKGGTENETITGVLPLHEQACHCLKTRTAWQIECLLRQTLQDRIWTKHSTEIFRDILRIAEKCHVPDNGPWDPELEAQWRACCWRRKADLTQAGHKFAKAAGRIEVTAKPK